MAAGCGFEAMKAILEGQGRGTEDGPQQAGRAGVGAEMNPYQDQVTTLHPNPLPPALDFCLAPSQSWRWVMGMPVSVGSPQLKLIGVAGVSACCCQEHPLQKVVRSRLALVSSLPPSVPSVLLETLV